MNEPDSRVPRSYVTRPAPDLVPDEPPAPVRSPRDQRLALYRSASHTLGGRSGAGTTDARPRRLLVTAAVLAGIPASLVLGATSSVLGTMLTLPLGLPTWWGQASWNLVVSTFALGPWLLASWVSAVALLLVDLVRPQPRDGWGRTVPRGRRSVALMSSTLGLLALVPVVAVSGFLLFLASAYVCSTSSSTCW